MGREGLSRRAAPELKPRPRLCRRGGAEAADSFLLIVVTLKHGVELCDLHEVANFALDVQQPDGAALVRRGRIGADQLAQPRAIHVADVLQVQQPQGVHDDQQVIQT